MQCFEEYITCALFSRYSPSLSSPHSRFIQRAFTPPWTTSSSHPMPCLHRLAHALTVLTSRLRHQAFLNTAWSSSLSLPRCPVLRSLFSQRGLSLPRHGRRSLSFSAQRSLLVGHSKPQSGTVNIVHMQLRVLSILTHSVAISLRPRRLSSRVAASIHNSPSSTTAILHHLHRRVAARSFVSPRPYSLSRFNSLP